MSRVRDIADNSAVFADGISTADITEGANLFSQIVELMQELQMQSKTKIIWRPTVPTYIHSIVKAYVDTEVAGLIYAIVNARYPNELAAALGDDAN